MASEVAAFRKNQTLKQGNINKAPALDPNTSMRRLSITQGNVGSFNALNVLGSINQQKKERTVFFTTQDDTDLNGAGNKRGAMGDLASSTITDLRQIISKCALDDLDPSNKKMDLIPPRKERLSGAQSSSMLPSRPKPKFNMNNTINGNLRRLI